MPKIASIATATLTLLVGGTVVAAGLDASNGQPLTGEAAFGGWQQDKRARQAVYERTRVATGVIDYYMKVAERDQADEDAARDHATFSAIQASGPVAAPAAAECSRCGNTFPVERVTYALDGRQMCIACHATYDERAERREDRRVQHDGVPARFLPVGGGSVDRKRRNKPAESAGLLVRPRGRHNPPLCPRRPHAAVPVAQVRARASPFRNRGERRRRRGE